MNRREQLFLIWVVSMTVLAVACSGTQPSAPPVTVIPSQEQPTTTLDPRVAWLSEHAIRLHSIDPADQDFSDLQSLKPVIGDSKIVMLGEQSHGDGATFLAKTRLIKFLHQEMGFDVLAFESPLYDTHKAWERLQSGFPPSAIGRGIYTMWSESAQVQPLIDYMATTATTDHPLELAGFDGQFQLLAKDYLASDLTEFLQKIGVDGPERPNWSIFTEILTKLVALKYASGEPRPAEDAQTLTFNTVEDLQKDISTKATPETEREAGFWIQLLKSTAGYAQWIWKFDPRSHQVTDGNLRDAQMGDNLLWLSNVYYPQRKIIVWAATFHIIHNPEELEPSGLSSISSYQGAITMGDVVWKALGKQIYVIGFTAYDGEMGLWNGKPAPLAKPAGGTLEDLMYTAGLENALVDFRGTSPGAEWLHRPLVSRPLGYAPLGADWSRILDGMVFTKRMTPSTKAQSEK